MTIEPYLFFNGCCEEAIAFYQKALGAEVLMTMRYKDSPEPPPPGMVPAGWDNKIMHTCVRIGDANVMASDGCSDGAHFQVQMPLGKTFWSPCFGMVTDRFGVGWMVTVAQ